MANPINPGKDLPATTRIAQTKNNSSQIDYYETIINPNSLNTRTFNSSGIETTEKAKKSSFFSRFFKK